MITTTCKAVVSKVPTAQDEERRCPCMVAVIGAGTLGTSIAFALLSQCNLRVRLVIEKKEVRLVYNLDFTTCTSAKNVSSDLVLMDVDESMARGEMLDIEHATMYLGSPSLKSTNNFEDLTGAKFCIVTVGARAGEEAKDEAAKRNTEIFKTVIPNVTKRAPDCVILILSYPVEVMTYVAWKLSQFPPHRVMGLGTVLESANFRRLVAAKLGVSVKCCQAFVIGEQGPNSVPVWSSVNVSGVRLKSVNPDMGTPDDPEDWADLHRQVLEGAEEVAKLKTMGSWGIALSVARIAKVILEDRKECIPVSTHIRGCRHGVDKDVFMSLPCILGKGGVESMIRQDLTDEEKEKLQKCADAMFELHKQLPIQ